MNKEQFKGIWNQMKGKVKEKWGKLTDEDIAQINGQREVLLGKLEQRYGKTKEFFEEQLNEWEEKFTVGAGAGARGKQERGGASSSSQRPSGGHERSRRTEETDEEI